MRVRSLCSRVSVGLGLLAIAGLFGRYGWPWETIASILPQIALASALAFAVSLATGRRPAMAVAACTCLLAVFVTRAQFEQGPPPLDDPDLRIVWGNVYNRADAQRDLIALAERENAQIVVLGEIHSDGLDRIDSYPYRVRPAKNIHSEVRILATQPIAYAGHLPSPHVSGPVATIATPAGDIHIAGTHLYTPLLPRKAAIRNRDLRAMTAGIAGRERTVLVGDFNTVPWSRALREADGTAGLTRVRYGPAMTWSPWQAGFGTLPFLGLPIDHAFVTGDLEAHVRVGPDIGSDHRPLIVDVKIRD